MSSPDVYARLSELRVVAADHVEQAMLRLLPDLAGQCRAIAQRCPDERVARHLRIMADALTDEAVARAGLAASIIDEMHFRLLRLGGPERRRQPRLARSSSTAVVNRLMPEVSGTEASIAARVAARVLHVRGAMHAGYLQRLAALDARPAIDGEQPLGALGHLMAIVTACRPFAAQPALATSVEHALNEVAIEPVDRLMQQLDDWLRQAGIVAVAPDPLAASDRQSGADPVTRPVPSARTTGAPRAVVPLPASFTGASTADRLMPRASTPVASSAARGHAGDPATSGRPGAPALPGGTPAHFADLPSAGAADAGLPDAGAPDDDRPDASAPDADATDADAPAPPDEAMRPLRRVAADARDAARLSLRRMPPAGATLVEAGRQRQARRLAPVLELDHDARAFARHFGVDPYSSHARQVYFRELRARLDMDGADVSELLTVDLVASVFDYTADDPRLPSAARSLLWRLQRPAIVLASLDPSYLAHDDRSIRSLVEHLAAIAVAFPDQIRPGQAMHARLASVVRAVEIVAHALLIRSRVLHAQADRESRRASHGMAELVARLRRDRTRLAVLHDRRNRRDYRRRPTRELEAEVTQRIERFVAARLHGRHVPQSVVQFLNDAWVRHMRTAALRDGESSVRYQTAARIVDDLLWTIDGGGRPRDGRRELARRIPTLIRLLTQGVDEIGASSDDFRPFFDEMFIIHLRRMQRGGRVIPAMQAAGDAPPSADDAPRAGVDGSGATATDPRPPHRPRTHRRTPPTPVTTDTTIADPLGAHSTMTSETDPVDRQTDSEMRLRRLVEQTSIDDRPRDPVRIDLTADQLGNALEPGQWLELISSTGQRSFAKVAWMNHRRSIALLLQHPDRLILSRHVAALVERAARGRVFRVH